MKKVILGMTLFLSICFAENIGLKGLYLNDDIGSACEQLKKLSVQIPDSEYVSTFTKCIVREKNHKRPFVEKGELNLEVNSIYVESLDNKVTRIYFGYDSSNIFFKRDQYTVEQFAKILLDNLTWIKTLKPILLESASYSGKYKKVEQMVTGYESVDGELGYKFQFNWGFIKLEKKEVPNFK